MGTRENGPIDLDWMKWPLLWLVLAAVFAIVLGSFNIPRFERLVAHGVQAQATVVKLTPQDHGTLHYEYQVGGANFEGHQSPWRPNPPIEQITVGQSVVICYDPLNPSLSVLGDPQSMLTNEIVAIGIGTLIFPTFLVIILSSRKQSEKGKRVF